MRIATFNVNSVRAHLANIMEWLESAHVDVVLMQEIKCETHAFPAQTFEDAGYNVAVYGQKSYNGVAILSRLSIEDVNRGIPGYDDASARYIDAVIDGYFRIVNVYIPNGNPIGTEKFRYTLDWRKQLEARLRELLKYDEPLIIGGDMNVVVDEGMIYDPKALLDDAVRSPEVIASFARLSSEMPLNLVPNREYTYYDYRAGMFAKGKGVVLDYFLVNDKVEVSSHYVDKTPRLSPGASDHVPLILETI